MIKESLSNIVLYDTAKSRQKLGSWFGHFRQFTDTETMRVSDSIGSAIAMIKEEINNRSGDCPETFIQLLRDWSNALKCSTATNTPLVGRMYHSLYKQLFSTNDWFEPIIINDEESFTEQFSRYRSYVSNKYTTSMSARNIQPYIVPGSQPYDGLPTALYVIQGRHTAGMRRVKHNRKNIKNLDDLSKHLLDGYNREMPDGFEKHQLSSNWQQRELKQLKKFWEKTSQQSKDTPDEFRQMIVSLKFSPKDPVTGFVFFRKNRESYLKRINPDVQTKDDSYLMKRADVNRFLKKLDDLKDISIDELFRTSLDD